VSAASFVGGALAVPVLSLSAILLYPVSSPSIFSPRLLFCLCLSTAQEGKRWSSLGDGFVLGSPLPHGIIRKAHEISSSLGLESDYF
jgi:hypothetical protein